jgi:hypothetical protein
MSLMLCSRAPNMLMKLFSCDMMGFGSQRDQIFLDLVWWGR